MPGSRVLQAPTGSQRARRASLAHSERLALNTPPPPVPL